MREYGDGEKHDRHTHTDLYAAFLDLSKAYDSMEYSVILGHLIALPDFPLTWVEMLRNVLAGNSTTILGVRVAFTRGLPQGGALCPFLCQAFMDTYATRARARHAARAPAFTPVWPPETHPARYWWLPSNVVDFDLRQYIYADDVALLAASVPELQEDLDEAHRWSVWAGIDWSPKSFIVALSTHKSSDPPPQDEVRLGDLILPWRTEPFPYLGVGTHPAHSAMHARMNGKQQAPLDLKRLNRNLYGLTQVCQLSPSQPYLVTPALRFAVQQVVNAAALYTTAINDTDYESLDRRTLATIRSALGLPMQMPSAYLRWALRLPPSELYGHGRGLTTAFATWHHSWAGRTLLRPLWTGDDPNPPPRYNRRPRPPVGSHPVFRHGPLARWDRLMQTYFPELPRRPAPPPDHHGLYQLHGAHRPWEERHLFKDDVDSKLAKSFKQWTLDAIEAIRLPAPLRAAMRRLVEEDPCGPDEPPLWCFLPDDLPRAVILFQAPFLGHSFHSELLEHGRPPCAWCGEADSEWGYHLLTCPQAPAHVTRQRDATLQAIVADVHPQDDPDHAPWDSPTNMERLYLLNWRGRHPLQIARRQHRTDTGHQASAHVLRMAAWYMRTCINAYSPHSEMIGRNNPKPKVTPLRVYGHSPFH
jgi:hypothetical protein